MSAEKGIKDTLSQLKTQFSTSPPKAHIIGISGAGGNGAQYLANHTDPGTHEHMSMTFLDTDRENIALRLKKAEEEGNKCFLKWIESGRCSFLLIGEEITKGRGAGGDPEQGARAVEASKEAIMEHIGDADLVLSITGLGGGTGTKGSAVIAKLAKEAGKESFVVGIKPFVVEENRLDYADEGEDQA